MPTDPRDFLAGIGVDNPQILIVLLQPKSERSEAGGEANYLANLLQPVPLLLAHRPDLIVTLAAGYHLINGLVDRRMIRSRKKYLSAKIKYRYTWFRWCELQRSHKCHPVAKYYLGKPLPSVKPRAVTNHPQHQVLELARLLLVR